MLSIIRISFTVGILTDLEGGVHNYVDNAGIEIFAFAEKFTELCFLE